VRLDHLLSKEHPGGAITAFHPDEAARPPQGTSSQVGRTPSPFIPHTLFRGQGVFKSAPAVPSGI